ncbi:unnamed protein product [Linum trigynum]|uniref:Uncharacterized protein n=1 Tax=Linum trigynum TaxID=586398 RepID=A0AAV2GVW2_9ROSI
MKTTMMIVRQLEGCTRKVSCRNSSSSCTYPQGRGPWTPTSLYLDRQCIVTTVVDSLLATVMVSFWMEGGAMIIMIVVAKKLPRWLIVFGGDRLVVNE